MKKNVGLNFKTNGFFSLKKLTI